MIKLAYNKSKPNLVFAIDGIVRVPFEGGIVEYYKGTLKDTSTVPDTETETYKVQVMAFESKWVEVPTDVGGTSGVNNQAKSATPAKGEQEIKPDAHYTGLSKVTIAATPLEEKTVPPSTTSQEVVATTEGKVGLSKVTVSAVTSDIDANIVAGNIKDGVTILGVAGTYVRPDEPNLIAENIKKDVTIYGVTGTYEGTTPEE